MKRLMMALVCNETHEAKLSVPDDFGLRSATLQKPFQKKVLPLS